MHDEYEPLDLEHEAVVKDEPDPSDEPRPMSAARLTEIHERYDAPHNPVACRKECWYLAHEDVPALLAEVERLRRELDRWKALPVRWEYAIGDGNWPPHPDVVTTTDRPFACQVADMTGHPLFGRRVHVGDFEELRAEAPF